MHNNGMKLSQEILDAVEAALPGPSEAGIATRVAHSRVRGWGRTTVRHALAALARSGRVDFLGVDRHRLYRRAATAAGVAEREPREMCQTPEAEQIRALAEEGLSDAEIGARFGRSQSWASRLRRRYDIAVCASDDSPWRQYAALPDGSVRRPDSRLIADVMRRRGIRYADVSAAELRREERLGGWSWPNPVDSAALTRAVFGDPPAKRADQR
jgi:Homeodomain-like domain